MRPNRVLRLCAALAALVAASTQAYAADWGLIANISSTMGANGSRLCIGEGSRPTDIGCPSYAPSVTTAGNLIVSGSVTANSFVGDGSGLTGISTQGDRITSGTLAAITNSATGYISLTTNTTNWGYLSSGASYLPNLTAGLISATNISGTLIQVGTGNGANCDSAHKGSMRYSSTSNTMEYCNSSAWTGLGPSSSQPVAFLAYKSSDQSFTAGTPAKITWNATAYDTYNSFSLANNRFQPTVAGYYLLTTSIDCSSNATNTCAIYIYKNGAASYGNNQGPIGNGYMGAINTTIMYLNGTTDYAEVWVTDAAGYVRGIASQTYFTGAIISPQAGGSGGSTSPGGNSTNIQYNGGGAFAGSDNFAWVNGSNTVSVTGTVSATYGYFKYISATNGGLGVSALASLTDVSVSTSPMDGGILTYAGGKWQAVSPSQVLSTSTMIPNWPDAIRCSRDSDGMEEILVLNQATSTTLVSYRPILNTAADRYIAFSKSTGAYLSSSSLGYNAYNCGSSSLSISQLYSLGRAFNFIGNNGASGSNALGDRITSGTTSIVANSNTNIISITTSGVTIGYFNSAGLLVVPGISITQNYGISSTAGYFSGNVGIGTTSPGANLDVSGTVSGTSFFMASIAGLAAPVSASGGSGGSGLSGGGTSGQVTYWNGTSSLTGSSVFTYSGSTLTVTNISATALTVNGVAVTGGAAASDRIVSGSVSAIAEQTSGTVRVSGTLALVNTGNETCGPATYNTIRINPTTHQIQLCHP